LLLTSSAVLHVATVHWQSPWWIEPQLRYLSRYAPGAQTWASLDGIAAEHFARFDHPMSLEGSHADKLNELARLITAEADADDRLLFLDGDAFPVAPLEPLIAAPDDLIAVRRDESRWAYPRPHPCFCLTTVGFWNEIGGDWSAGFTWEIANGDTVTDVGGNLIGILEEREIAWRPLTRLNITNLHPLWFALYGDDRVGPTVYHHSAGFRPRYWSSRPARRARVPMAIPVLGRAERSIRWRLRQGRGAKKSASMDTKVRAWIAEDDDLVARFCGRPATETRSA
jgi:hypothetical protein